MDLKNQPIFYVCNDPERALGLEDKYPNFHIVCIDKSPLIRLIREAGGKVYCLEEQVNKVNPIFRNSHRLLKNPLVQEYIRTNTPEGAVPMVMFFKIAPNLERICQELGYKILNTSADLNHKFELKISQYEMLKRIGANFPETAIMKLRDANYDDLIKFFGGEFVIQYDRGHTGTGTIFVKERQTLENEAKVFPDRDVRVSKKIEGDAWTINCCATRGGIIYGGLSYQITGVPECTSQVGGTVGNDWSKSSALSTKSIDSIRLISENVGKVMFSSGYRGLFGLDLVIDKDGEVFLIEVNARQPASTGMHTKLLRKAGLIPLAAFHLAEFLCDGDKDYFDFLSSEFALDLHGEFSKLINDYNSCAILPISASQIIVRNTLNDEVIVHKELRPGVYCYAGDLCRMKSIFPPKDGHCYYNLRENGDSGIVLIKDAYNISQIDAAEGMLMYSAPAKHKINTSGELFRMQAPFSLLDEHNRPKHWVIDVINGIRRHIL